MSARTVYLSDAEVIDNHVHGFRIEDVLAQDPEDFETRQNLLGTLFSDSTLLVRRKVSRGA
jgi:hypothetical protein